jgi:ribonuclease HI
MNQLFCDGGVVGSNPSAIGGTYAWRQVVDDQPVAEGAHFISARDARVPAVTNNLTEMLALIKGLESLPADWRGTVLSDSQITLGRAFLGWKWNNIPLWAHHRFQTVRAWLVHFDAFEHVLLAGHPTRAQLAAGIGRHGYPVSLHNVWCDKACTRAGEEALEQMQYQIKPTNETLHTSVDFSADRSGHYVNVILVPVSAGG